MLHTILWIVCVLLGGIGLGLLRSTKKVANNIVVDILCGALTIWFFMISGYIMAL